MESNNKIQTRKKFIGIGISTAALFTAFRFLIPSKKKKTETVKMLTEDGKLVEVDIASLPSQKKLISNKELQNWIKK